MPSITDMVKNSWSLSKPHRYLVHIPGASNARTLARKGRIEAAASLWLNCKSINVPGVAFTELTHAYSGQYPIDIPTSKNFSKLSAEFYLSENHYERSFFLEWSQDIFNEGDASFNFPDEYKRDITIFQLPNNGNSITDAQVIYTIMDAYPKSVGDVMLSYSEINSVGEFQVGFAFTRMRVLNKDGKVLHGAQVNDVDTWLPDVPSITTGGGGGW